MREGLLMSEMKVWMVSYKMTMRVVDKYRRKVLKQAIHNE